MVLDKGFLSVSDSWVDVGLDENYLCTNIFTNCSFLSSICAWSAIRMMLDEGFLSLSDIWVDVGLDGWYFVWNLQCCQLKMKTIIVYKYIYRQGFFSSICAWSAIGMMLDKGLFPLCDVWVDVGLA